MVVSCATKCGMSSLITRYRKARDLTLQALATDLSIDKSNLWRWERGRVPVARLRDVERVTGISRAKLRPDIFGKDAR